ncbi:MAG: Ig-like domain-containing protein [Pirellulaceae bacterium]
MRQLHWRGAYGSLEWNEDGSFVYSIDNANIDVLRLSDGQSLSETFQYTISDKDSGTGVSTLTVTITGINDAPVAGDDADTIDLRVTDATTGFLTTNDSDVDDAFTVTAVNGEEAFVGVRFELPSGALLRVQADGDYDYDPNGAFDSLAAGETGVDTFHYTITDRGDNSDVATVTINVIGKNEAPSRIGLSKSSIRRLGCFGHRRRLAVDNRR